MTKVCGSCGIEKNLSRFVRCGGANDGRRNQCKLCDGLDSTNLSTKSRFNADAQFVIEQMNSWGR